MAVKIVLKFDKSKKKISRGVTDGLRLAAIGVIDQAVHLADFKKGYQTGRLRNSLSYSIEGRREGANKQGGAKATPSDLVLISDAGETVNIGTSVKYAQDVEYGTCKMESQPYLRPALDIMRPKIEKFIGAKLKEVLGK